MYKTLYIIGNGFDLHHGIQSSYWMFGEFLSEEDSEVSRQIDEYIANYGKDLWGKFEENLANFDQQALLETASEFLVGYGAEDWSDAYHHDYQYEIEQVVSGLSEKLLERFKQWVKGLEIPLPSEAAGNLVTLDSNAIFLNFNYTSTLNKTYGISQEKILHIHGHVQNDDERIVLGHGWRPAPKVDPRDNVDFDGEIDEDARIQEGDQIIESYFKRTFKNTKSIIESNKPFFESLKSIEKIIVLGHSLSDVDLPYFYEIVRNINVANVTWEISYYDEAEILRIQEQVQTLGINERHVSYIQLADLIP